MSDQDPKVIPSSIGGKKDREPVLYHYTTYPGLEGIVRSKSLWCSKIQFLNDRTELKDGFQILKAVCQSRAKEHALILEILNRINAYESINVFVCSFTEERDLLSQWRGYGGNGGVSIEFSFNKLLQHAERAAFMLMKVIYDPSEKWKKTEDFLERIVFRNSDPSLTADQVIASFLPTAMCLKNQAFREEKEWRLMSRPTNNYDQNLGVRASTSGLVPYLQFSLGTSEKPLLSELQPWRDNEDICITGVMVGPHPEQELQMDAVGQLFESHRAYVGSVGRSMIPFRA